MNKQEEIRNYKVGQKVAIYGYIDAIDIENISDIENTTTLRIKTPVKTISINPKYEEVVTDFNKSKPVVPQFVADWYEERKDYFDFNIHGFYKYFYSQGKHEEVKKWIDNAENKAIETLVKMKLYGYEVEKDKLYLASFRDTNQYLGWNEQLGEWFMSCSPFTSGVEQTRETWEGVGIWNNPAFEIKKVEE